MKRVFIPISELDGDKYHRFNMTPATSEVLGKHGLSLDSRGIPKHPWTTYYDDFLCVQVFEQGERY